MERTPSTAMSHRSIRRSSPYWLQSGSAERLDVLQRLDAVAGAFVGGARACVPLEHVQRELLVAARAAPCLGRTHQRGAGAASFRRFGHRDHAEVAMRLARKIVDGSLEEGEPRWTAVEFGNQQRRPRETAIKEVVETAYLSTDDLRCGAPRRWPEPRKATGRLDDEVAIGRCAVANRDHFLAGAAPGAGLSLL